MRCWNRPNYRNKQYRNIRRQPSRLCLTLESSALNFFFRMILFLPVVFIFLFPLSFVTFDLFLFKLRWFSNMVRIGTVPMQTMHWCPNSDHIQHRYSMLWSAHHMVSNTFKWPVLQFRMATVTTVKRWKSNLYPISLNSVRNDDW